CSRPMPRVAILTTVPANPASPTTRLLPPATRSSDSPAASAVETASMSCCSEVPTTKRPAGPPSRNVVWSASSTDSDTDDRLGQAEHLGPLARDGQRDRGEPVGDLLDRAGDLQPGALVIVGNHDRVGEFRA